MNQLISYIALGAPATRRPATGSFPWLRPEIGFTPNWYHKALNIDFGKKWHTDPVSRKQSVLAMRHEIDKRFPGNKIGRISENPDDLDLLTGVHGACTIAAIYGIPVRYEKDKWPVCEHVLKPDMEMKEIQRPDLKNNRFFDSVLDQIDWIAQNEGRVNGFINWQGVLNNAQRLRGQDIFTEILTHPDKTKKLLASICEKMIEAAKIVQHKQRVSGINYTFFTVSNCLVNMLSSELYEEFILPFDQKIAETFETIGIHNCAWNADPYLEAYSGVTRVGYIDMGIESDLSRAKELFPDTRRALMYTPMDLANKPFYEIRNDLELIAEKYGPCDIVAADIEHGTTDHKVSDFIQLCEDISNNNQ
jgi:hypothetical protein